MITNNGKLLISIYKDPILAERAYSTLIDKGYNKNDISVVIISDQIRDKHFINTDLPQGKLKSKVTEGMGFGATIGGTLGALTAAIAAIGTIVAFPGVSLVVSGPLAASLAGSGAVGALVGLGFTGKHTKQYEEEIKSGKILIIVKTSKHNYNKLENELKNMIQ